MPRAKIKVTENEDSDNPFLLSMGTALRDYKTLFEAVKKLNIKTKVVAGPRATEGLEIPENVEIISGITFDECRKLLQQARLNVIPMHERPIATGQVTILESIRIGRPTIVTNCNGAEDYIEDGVTGLTVEPNSVASMTHAISSLWNNSEKRNALGKAAESFSDKYLSDETVSMELKNILDTYL